MSSLMSLVGGSSGTSSTDPYSALTGGIGGAGGAPDASQCAAQCSSLSASCAACLTGDASGGVPGAGGDGSVQDPQAARAELAAAKDAAQKVMDNIDKINDPWVVKNATERLNKARENVKAAEQGSKDFVEQSLVAIKAQRDAAEKQAQADQDRQFMMMLGQPAGF